MATTPHFSTAQPEIVQIARARKPASVSERLSGGPVADKFFASAAIGSFVGSTGLGVYMWLVRHGQLAAPADFSLLRNMHAVIQFELFFGLLILGFSLQAGPKLLGLPQRPHPLLLLLLPIALLGVVWLALFPSAWPPKLLVSAPFVFGAARLVRLTRVASLETTVRYAPLLLTSLLSLAAVPWIGVILPPQGVLIFWGAVAAALFATSQQFTANFIGGERMSPKFAVWFAFAFVLSLITGTIALRNGEPLLWRAFGGMCLILTLAYVWALKLFPFITRAPKGPLQLAFLAGFYWAMLGAIGICWFGIYSADLVLHSWAIGWAGTVVLAVSSQVLQFLSGQPLYSGAVLWRLILGWQLAAAGRGISPLFGSPAVISWIVGISVLVVLSWWCIAVVRASARVLRNQRALARGERMQSC